MKGRKNGTNYNNSGSYNSYYNNIFNDENKYKGIKKDCWRFRTK